MGTLRTARVPQPVNARVVAIGGVHGDLIAATLKAAQLVDERYRWSAGRDILVLTGDLVERGADTKSVLRLLYVRKRGQRGRWQSDSTLGTMRL